VSRGNTEDIGGNHGADCLSGVWKFCALFILFLFAHRGGVLEVPEGTQKAFEYARDEAGVDILELDVQLTRDRQFVVWHGPGLDNVLIEVLIEGQDGDPLKRREGRKWSFAATAKRGMRQTFP